MNMAILSAWTSLTPASRATYEIGLAEDYMNVEARSNA